MASPIDRLFGTANLRCTKCAAPAGTCDCWTKCRCGWSYERGDSCSNPVHPCEDAAQQAADFIAATVISRMRLAYPEPMRHASGGFAKTLRASITSEARAMVLEILLTSPPEPATGDGRSQSRKLCDSTPAKEYPARHAPKASFSHRDSKPSRRRAGETS